MKEKRRRTYLHRSRDQARWAKGNHRVLLFGTGGKGARNWEEVLKDLKRRGIQRVRILLTDDFSGLEEATRRFSRSSVSLCILHAVRDALNKVREKNREALDEVLKKFDRAESWNEVVEALRNIPRSWSAGRPRPMLF